MHRLLQRQLRRHLLSDAEPQPQWHALLTTIDAYYAEVDQERSLLENAMAVSSDELTDAIAGARSQHAMLRGVMDSIPDLICFKTSEGRYLGCNKAFERYLRRPEAEVIGLTDFDLMPADIAAELLANDQEVLRIRSRRLSEHWIHMPGRQRRVCLEILSTPYQDLDGRLLGLISIARNITARKKAESTIQRQALCDNLTGLPNRHGFYQRLAQVLSRADQTGLPAALLLIDLDRFKEVNDLLGHAAGDALLQEAARRIGACVRETDTAARLGGDEFTVILDGLQAPGEAERTAQAVLDQLSVPFRLGDDTAWVTASIGIAFYPGGANDMETLIRHADQAMYMAKSHGRNRFSAFDEVLRQAGLRRQRLRAEIGPAAARGQLTVHYQPVIDLASGRIELVEALVRWQHPVEGLIGPAEFLGIAEDTGALADIGDFVLDTAIADLRHLRDGPDAALRVAVNVAPAQFREGAGRPERWLAALARHGLPGNALVLDITEGLLSRVDAALERQLQTLRAAGVGLALDDHGNGYCALAMLQRLQVGSLKIDAGLVGQTEASAPARAVCRAMIAMAHELDMKVLAEGVATAAQRDWLASAGCDQGQGYLWGAPMPCAELAALLDRNRAAPAPLRVGPTV